MCVCVCVCVCEATLTNRFCLPSEKGSHLKEMNLLKLGVFFFFFFFFLLELIAFHKATGVRNTKRKLQKVSPLFTVYKCIPFRAHHKKEALFYIRGTSLKDVSNSLMIIVPKFTCLGLHCLY